MTGNVRAFLLLAFLTALPACPACGPEPDDRGDGGHDACPCDAGRGPDAGGAPDGGPSDGGPSDGGPSDGGPSDGGPSDGGRASEDAGCSGCVSLERLFPTQGSPGEVQRECHLASPLAYQGASGLEILSPVGEEVVALDPTSGARTWAVTLPAPEGEMAFIVATPLLLGDRLVVGYHTTDATAENRDVLLARHRHRVVVVDLASRALDPAFPTLELEGEAATDAGPVVFDPGHALGRAALANARLPGDVLGKVYVTFGNALDLQPWHGFAFEIDLDAWLASGAAAAVSGFFVDTPEVDCGQNNASGSSSRVCGGGMWAPSGPLVIPTDGGYDVVLASGNGQLDLARDDFANTLMRAPPGLAFEPACDEAACASFDPDEPARACVESCARLFIPRMPEGADFSSMVSGDRCLGLTMFECWEKLDYIGGSTPALIDLDDGQRVLLYPTKDGSVYLVDVEHLGTLYERRQLVPICGTATSSCTAGWAGMIVTQPTVTILDGEPLALVPTFMPDAEQEAGVFALKVVVTGGEPRLEEAWRWPPQGSPEARARFRRHPSRIALAQAAGRELAVVVDAPISGASPGRLVVLDVASGALLVDAPLAGRGYRFVMPLVAGDRVYTPSCASNAGDSWLEGYRLTSGASPEGT